MIKITEKEYDHWKYQANLQGKEEILLVALNILDNLLCDGESQSVKGVCRSFIACNARYLEEEYDITFKGWFKWREHFEY